MEINKIQNDEMKELNNLFEEFCEYYQTNHTEIFSNTSSYELSEK